MTHYLFSYGTLQDKSVQLTVFGRGLTGFKDSIKGYKLSTVEIKEEEVVLISGLTHHLILVKGNEKDLIEGTVFEITDEELVHADEYEAEDYKRVLVPTLSGKEVWVYVEAAINQHPLVSVILPFLNGAAWLGEAVESVLKQTYQNWELILMDDGSGPEATLVAKQFRDQYRGQIIYADHADHKNLGVTASRNAAIALSTGSLIAFLDSDDKWMTDKLQHQVGVFRNYPAAAMICEASLFWYSWNDDDHPNQVMQVGATPDSLHAPGELLARLYPLGAGAPPCPSGIILSREAFERSGGFEESFTGEYQLYEDQAFLAKIYLHEYVYVSGVPHNYYRKRDGSLTSAANDEVHYKKVRRFYLEWFEKYLETNNSSNHTIRNLIRTVRESL